MESTSWRKVPSRYSGSAISFPGMSILTRLTVRKRMLFSVKEVRNTSSNLWEFVKLQVPWMTKAEMPQLGIKDRTKFGDLYGFWLGKIIKLINLLKESCSGNVTVLGQEMEEGWFSYMCRESVAQK